MGDAVGPPPVYLWTLPMFHRNGWASICRPGQQVCLRQVNSETHLCGPIAEHRVTHLCVVLIVMSILLERARG